MLYKPEEIVEVRNARLDTIYEEGKDWVVEDGRLWFPPQSRVPITRIEEMFPEENREGWVQKRVGGGYSLFSEGRFFHDKQVVVSYKCRKTSRYRAIGAPEAACPKRTAAKLANAEPLNLLVFGDSIAEGANASGKTGAAPFMPTWGEQVSAILEETYGSKIAYKNGSVGGITSEGGLRIVDRVLEDLAPDVAIIAFGMNDGTSKVAPDQYAANISAIMKRVENVNGAADFILVAPMLANPDTFFSGNQAEYADVLRDLASASGGRAAVADMTAVHRELLKYKNYADLTGNNVNHPNDFLIRCYAQVLLSLIMGRGEEENVSNR
ncbi:SGNH/GDSL hydrolase family protein [Cohnella ginsengisoli]|uniref:SGNH/GDSL hydrolase family protein n=1 Tax=Cohnella ginsengisoli TaxID=425004 RepID=A0A9X4KLT1_9BACL|nr:SGNH/GDSL hydrolase family protein [Cohnella ginsengisoli]MDG0794260.1 SGNH/GDSL hydrolase family protein [Cohnella ginsengisoli]